MSGAYCSPYPHHSWLANWITVCPPQVFDVHERRHVAHHLLLTTSGGADIRWMSGGTEMAYHSAIGSLSFLPCDHQPHSLSITAVDGFIAYDLIMTLQYLFAVRGAPEHLRSDNGPEFVAKEIQEWL